MYTFIFSVVFLLIAGCFIGFGILKGKKYVWQFSVTRALTTTVSAIAAAFLSALMAKVVSKILLKAILKVLPLDAEQLIAEVPFIETLICALLSFVFSFILFYALFSILRIVLDIILKIFLPLFIELTNLKKKAEAKELENASSDEAQESLSKKELAKQKKRQKKLRFRVSGPNPVGMACGAVCGLLLFVAFMFPAVGLFSLADDVMLVVDSYSESEVIEIVADVANGAADNIGSQTVEALGGKWLYGVMTTYRSADGTIYIQKELALANAAGNAISKTADASVTRADAATAIRGIEESFNESTILPTLMPQLLNAANDHWAAGDDFCGINKPSFGASLDGVVSPVLTVLGNSTTETIRGDVGTVLHVVAYMVEQDAMSGIKQDPMGMFKNTEVTSTVLYEFLNNPRLAPLVGDVSEYGLTLMSDRLNVTMDNVNFDSSAITDASVESKALAGALGRTVALSDDLKGGSFGSADSIRTLGPLLDAFAVTQTVGKENTANILTNLFASEQVYSIIGFSREEAARLAGTINSKALSQGYTPLMLSLSQTVSVVQMSTKTDCSAEEMTQQVELLLQDLTPESSAVLQEMASPSVMINNGVPEQSAEPTSNMVSNVFANLSEAKENGMSEEEYNKEAKATTDLLNLAMNASSSEKTSTFGEGSATGKSADEVVDNIFDSKVVSKTVVETAYGKEGNGDTPLVDPLNTQKNLSESEQNEVLTALNNKWAQASDAEKNDPEYQKTYLAVGALMNMNLAITSGGVGVAP